MKDVTRVVRDDTQNEHGHPSDQCDPHDCSETPRTEPMTRYRQRRFRLYHSQRIQIGRVELKSSNRFVSYRRRKRDASRSHRIQSVSHPIRHSFFVSIASLFVFVQFIILCFRF